MKTLKKAVWLAILSAAFLFAFAYSSHSAGTMLRLALKKGKIYEYNTKMDMEMSAGEQTMPMNLEVAYRMSVTEERKDEQVVNCSYQRIKLDVPSMPEMSFDSDNPDQTTEIGKTLKGLIGSGFNIVITPEGKVKSVTGLKELAAKMKGAKANAVSQYLDEETVRKQFEQAFNYLPNKVVGVGDSWVREQSIPGQLPVKLLTTYRVKSITGDRVTVDFNSQVKPDNSAKPAPGMEEAELSGDMLGTMELEKESGFPVNSHGNMNIVAEKEGTEIFKMKGAMNVKGIVK